MHSTNRSHVISLSWIILVDSSAHDNLQLSSNSGSSKQFEKYETYHMCQSAGQVADWKQLQCRKNRRMP